MMGRFSTISIALLLCSTGLASCGGSSGGNLATAGLRTSTTNSGRDRDDDHDHNDDDAKTLYYGHAATPADWHAVATLVERYYHAAGVENGKAGCAQLFPPRAEAVAEDYGHVSYLRGKSCPVVLHKLFVYDHGVLKRKAHVKVDLVRVQGEKALAMISFSGLPAVRQIFARRVAGTWKLRELMDVLVE